MTVRELARYSFLINVACWILVFFFLADHTINREMMDWLFASFISLTGGLAGKIYTLKSRHGEVSVDKKSDLTETDIFLVKIILLIPVTLTTFAIGFSVTQSSGMKEFGWVLCAFSGKIGYDLAVIYGLEKDC
jgi:hypothetical protein